MWPLSELWGGGRLVPAGAGVGCRSVALCRPTLCGQGGGNVFARADAGVDVPADLQLVQGRLVQMGSARLPLHGRVGVQVALGQLLQDELVCARRAARVIGVFDAHPPLPVVGFGVKPTGQGRHQRARVQGTGGRGRKPAPVRFHLPHRRSPNSRPETKASSTRWPMCQSPQVPKPVALSH